jgi:hypothetical protein
MTVFGADASIGSRQRSYSDLRPFVTLKSFCFVQQRLYAAAILN